MKWNTGIIVKYLPLLEVNLTINWCAIMLLLCTIGVLYFLMVWRAYKYILPNLFFLKIGSNYNWVEEFEFFGHFSWNTKKCQWSYKYFCDIFKCSWKNCSLSKKKKIALYAKTQATRKNRTVSLLTLHINKLQHRPTSQLTNCVSTG